MQQPRKWWFGLPILLGVAYAAGDQLAPQIENDLSTRAAARLGEMSEAISDARVGVEGRDVTIRGLATSPQAHDLAVAAVGSLEGVRFVQDHAETLAEAKPFALTLRRDNGRVLLTGSLPPGDARARLRAALEKLGLEVEDHAAFANGAPPDFSELAQFAAQRLAALDPGVARLSEAALALEGDARPGTDYQKLLAEAKAPPKGARLERFDVEFPAVSPFVFSAKLAPGVLTLQGHAPSKAVEKLRALLPKLEPNVAISDGLAQAGGAPKDFAEAAAAGLTALARLETGELTLSDRMLSLSGEAAAGVEVGEALALALPQGYGLSLRIAHRADAAQHVPAPPSQ